MIGKILIYLAFVFSLISMIGFFGTHLGKEKYLKIGRLFYHLTAITVIAASFILLYNIVTHQFQYTYIWEHSNTDLQLPLLMSTFFAGQEGSFMLWTLMTAVIGIFLLNFVSKGKRFEPQVMSTYTLVLGFLALILILKSPFEYIWDSFPGEVQAGFVPENGRGLNPLLQSFWMVIHPPILFLGYASLAVPFAFAIATLMKNKYDEWITFSLPWLLFSAGVLGLGIMLGGYWAYGVLGWGGYWAWDPVENSSLIPWLITLAVIHTMLAQKKTGGYKKTNLVLCILTFLFVLYSTFLTRSGILGDSSVHSFTDPGASVYLALIIFINSFLLISIIAIIYRIKEFKSFNLETSNLISRESGLFIGAIVICASAGIIAAGTSWPIIAKGSIEADFYNRMNLPIAIIISFLIGISLFFEWKSTGDNQFIKKLIVPFVLAAIVTVILVIIGVQDLLMILFSLSALFAFFVNLQFIIRAIKNKSFFIGGHLSHIGIALLFLGVIGSARYSEEVNLSLELNKPTEAFGYTLTYTGPTEFKDPDNKTDQKFNFNVKVEKGNEEWILKPVMYYSEISEGVMKNPDIQNFMTKDLYISPMGVEEAKSFSDEDKHIFKKGDKKEIKGLSIEFVDFDFGGEHGDESPMSSMGNSIGVSLKVTDGKNTEVITPKITYTEDNPEYLPAHMSGNDRYLIYLNAMNVKSKDEGGSEITITVVDSENSTHQHQEDILIVTAAVKPFISVLWIGTGVLVIGFFIAIIRRRKELMINPKVSKNIKG
ncbi:heme lyase CcmF/NrfE family subunit [Bacteroidota bacterium]